MGVMVSCTCMYRINKGLNSKKSGTPSDRMARLARLGLVIVHASNLANLWRIKNSNTLYTTLRRYAQKGLLFRIYKGMYALKPIDELDPRMLGVKALHRFAYVTAETVLAQHGVILQELSAITLVSSVSRRFSIGSNHYVCRKLKERFLYNPEGIDLDNGVKTATLARAVADILYFNPRAYFDSARFIDWQLVRQVQSAVGYPLTPHQYVASKSKRRHA